MSWIGGRRELYQPVATPDVAGWPLVRRCTDRMAMMRGLLAREGIGEGASYLDVASCYGWFVSQFAALGYEARGIELDPLAVPLGQAAYGLASGAVTTGDAVSELASGRHRATVSSCFSLVHHFWLGRANATGEDLVRLLDANTERVLFLDAGQATERWFARSLAGWTPDAIAAWLRDVTTFDEVVALGVDEDDQPPFEGNYGRALFACVRR
jgi:hypothetical protein